mmetsp:Transcript_116095/g.361745  ORF Transcript_116095/g.361745 Transcript_116095/m.361745 type:complete len:542 (-) Transcript_116095:54-1679(-)|eukprot:CAMPEP_0204576236 /NCGR_PEP_ID=MMETSP0661-20131031/41658_1 /ASSEMBLY_ACC=CAM_ASM_000606 /TAXON_ID=109239 /ORGANISM="Alexandrium margalefi, Strain AMGDE01CS-322" /LENGTH=541 /DNA_ID=CAMNT_0051584963 /DNA_START=65 /DNA_END=1690 /DNA_ORIENTATION=-
MYDTKAMFRDDGSYDFKKREDWDYKHTYDYMAGWLGSEKTEAEKKRKKKLGKTDLEAPPIPADPALVESIEKTARYVHKSDDPGVFERLVAEKNKGKPGWDFLQENGEGNDYYKFVRHCYEREVDPRPLSSQARKIKDDRDLKQANAKNNVFTAGMGEATPKLKDPVFKAGELMEVVGIKNKPDYNGKIARVVKYHPEVDRYEVKFEGGRYDTVVVKLREENLMYSSVTERDPDADKEMEEGEIPNGTKVNIRGLQSEAAKWLNGQKGIIVQWDKDTERYEVRLEINNDVKKVKAQNVRVELPEGWEEHYDEHLQRSYYLNTKTQKVTWKHPTVANQRAKFGVVKENNIEDLEAEGVEIDADRKVYDVDDEEELEGGFNLHELVKKVEEQELKREAAEDAGEDVDSDDGMHSVKKKRKKKKQEVSVEMLQAKVAELLDQTMGKRITLRKDYKLLEGNVVAKDMDPIMDQWEADPEAGPELLQSTYEVMLGLLEKGLVLMSQVRKARLQLLEMGKIIDRITTADPKQLLEDAKWVHALLKTM